MYKNFPIEIHFDDTSLDIQSCFTGEKRILKRKEKLVFLLHRAEGMALVAMGDTALYHKGKIQLPELYTYREI